MAVSRSRRRSAWPDLTADLLGVVLGRLPSLADRVRLRAVCRLWRSSAANMLHQSPPQLPWLVFHDGALLDVYNNTAHRVRLPDDGVSCYCAGENMLFLLHDDGRCSLMNAFSNDVTPLPELAALLKDRALKSFAVKKVLVSSSPKLVAVLFRSSSGKGVIALTSCRPASEINSCQVLTTGDRDMDMIDIAIFQGKITAISRENKFLAVELHSDEQAPRFGRRIILTFPPSFTTSHGNYEVWRYLVESNGKLLMVRRWVSGMWHHERESPGRTRQLDVVEADLSLGRWNKVDGLEGHALFVSKLCSKSVPAAAAAAAGDGPQQDCIYFLDDRLVGGPSDSGTYSMGDRTITPLLPEEPAMPQPCPAWFFPVEV